MATTTPNFGWPVPTSSDLVKNGATAIEGLGDAIDASLLDLKGGTTNQVLAKNSNTDMDFKWVSDATGMTNPMTTTGDTIYSSSGSTPARLGIGSTGQVLTVAGGVPSWATPSSGTPAFVGASAYVSGTQSITAATLTTVDFANENYDTDGFHSTSSNTSRMTIPSGKAGKYLITGVTGLDSITDLLTGIIVNGVAITGSIYGYYNAFGAGTGDTARIMPSFGAILNLTAGDYVQLQVYTVAGGARTLEAGRFDIAYLGA
jgi:hypothetical protein